MINNIKRRKLQWLGHTSRHDCPIRVVLEETTLRKKGSGWPRTNFISQTCGQLGLKYVDIKRKINDRVKSKMEKSWAK